MSAIGKETRKHSDAGPGSLARHFISTDLSAGDEKVLNIETEMWYEMYGSRESSSS